MARSAAISPHALAMQAEQDLAQALGLVDNEKKKFKSVSKALEETEVKHSSLAKHYEETMQVRGASNLSTPHAWSMCMAFPSTARSMLA
jgi:predicted urease superfamily metal-dependent hydrolase